MEIQPKSTVKLLNVDFFSNYQNTLTFNNIFSQITHFLDESGVLLNNYTVVRENQIKVEGEKSKYFNYNYVMFNNSNFTNKWFFAFITNLIYVNPSCTVIEYELDVIQSYLFDFQFKECLIDREHVTDDTPFTHLESENIQVGEYLYYTNTYQDFNHLIGGNVIVVGTTEELPPSITNNSVWRYGLDNGYIKYFPPDVYNGFPKAIHSYTFKSDNAFTFKSIIVVVIDGLTQNGKLDSIVEFYNYYEKFFIDSDEMKPLKINITTKPSTVAGGYTPRNKKLLQYPFQFLEVGGYGEIQELKFELFQDDVTTMNLLSYPSPSSCISTYPSFYMGKEYNLDCMVSTPPLKPLQYTAETYVNEYMATMGTRNASINNFHLNQVQSIGSQVVAGGMMGGPVGAATGAIGAMSNSLFDYLKATNTFKGEQTDVLNRPPQLANQNSNPTIPWALGFNTPYYIIKGITEEFARKIDKYFDMFGYCVNRIGVPNIKSRPSYNFLKLKMCNLNGVANSSVLTKLSEIFCNGITFWHVDDIGNYNLPN